MRTPVIILGALAVLSGCAPAREPDARAPTVSGTDRQCFLVSQIDNFRQGGTGEVYLRVRSNGVYRLQAAGGCWELDSASQLALIPDGAGSVGTRACAGEWARIVAPGSASQATTCRVRVDRRLTEEEVAALPRGQRP